MKRYPAGHKILAQAEQQAEDQGEWILTFLLECLKNWDYGRRRFETAIGEINYLSAKAGGLVLGLDENTGELNVFQSHCFQEEADQRPAELPESLFSLTPRYGTPAYEATKGRDRSALMWRAATKACCILLRCRDVTNHPENYSAMDAQERAGALRLWLSAVFVGQEYCKIERLGRRAELVVDGNRWRGGHSLAYNQRAKAQKEKGMVAPPAKT